MSLSVGIHYKIQAEFLFLLSPVDKALATFHYLRVALPELE
jgi:hypothetical protein